MTSELVSRETIVTAALVYLAIGSLAWMAMYCTGFIQGAQQAGYSKIGITLASIGAIFGWPVIAWVFVGSIVKGRRR